MDIYNDSYSNYKVGGKCKVKTKTECCTFICNGTYNKEGECTPCDGVSIPSSIIPHTGGNGGHGNIISKAGSGYSGFHGGAHRLWFNDTN